MCDRSRLQGRATWKRRDVQEDVRAEGCAGAGSVRPERRAGSRAGGMLKEVGAKQSNSRLFWWDLKQSDAFLTPKFIALGLDGEGKGNI